MKNKIILAATLTMFFNISFGLEAGISKDVFKKQVYNENKQSIDKTQKLIDDSKKMTLEELSNKYSEEEVNYIKRINEVYETKDLEIIENLKPVNKLDGVQ